MATSGYAHQFLLAFLHFFSLAQPLVILPASLPSNLQLENSAMTSRSNTKAGKKRAAEPEPAVRKTRTKRGLSPNSGHGDTGVQRRSSNRVKNTTATSK
ncbi:hypothetical protein BKA70DRAFT_1435848 [Coprinopsis sp. MPI-PUGE-AT-0042]|nr:hypothetical protein BKA70DRAFT_1435848 [Coprinopsis sp. MPI-PUGE-AT-0042]